MIMKETIGVKLTELASRHVDFNLAEAEVEDYPYAVYTSTVTPSYTKDGIHHYQADVIITIYSPDLDECDRIAELIHADIAGEMRNGQYVARLMSNYPDCVEGIWSRELSYTIKQYR